VIRSIALVLFSFSAFAAEPLVPVVVAAVDIKAGETVTMEMISQRSAEPAVVTSSVVKPDSASYIVNQKTRFPILAGDLILWSFFEIKTGDEAQTKCAAAVQAPQGAEAQVAQHRVVVKAKKN
jgi:flagella basal body P-ring formation protein FlgA